MKTSRYVAPVLACLLLLPLLAPDLLDDLPPPALDQILGLLAGMLGLPF